MVYVCIIILDVQVICYNRFFSPPLKISNNCIANKEKEKPISYFTFAKESLYFEAQPHHLNF